MVGECTIEAIAAGIIFEVTFEDGVPEGMSGRININNNSVAIPAYEPASDLKTAYCDFIDQDALWLNYLAPATLDDGGNIRRVNTAYLVDFSASMIHWLNRATKMEIDILISKNNLLDNCGTGNYGNVQWRLRVANGGDQKEMNGGYAHDYGMEHLRAHENTELIDDVYYKHTYEIPYSYYSGPLAYDFTTCTYFGLQVGHWGMVYCDPVYISSIRFIRD